VARSARAQAPARATSTPGALRRPRPQHLGAPDPDGDDRRAGRLRHPDDTRLADEDRVEEGGTPRDRPLGHQPHEVTPLQGGDGCGIRGVPGSGAIDRDPTHAVADRADEGDVEELLLGEHPQRSAAPAHELGQDEEVGIAAVVEGDDPRPVRREVLEAGDVEAHPPLPRRVEEVLEQQLEVTHGQ
jgi:hypothetical protein